MFDAYTVKKVLPRLLVAVILIQLSWPLFTLLISVVSNVAWGLEGLLYAPFGGRDELEIGKILEDATGQAGLTLTLIFGGGAVVGGVAFALGGGVGLLLLALSTLLALVIGFFVLAIRQVLIVVLLVTAPLALVAWILPSTDKLWKIWWESFSKVLLMYPLILLLIAGGRIAAKVAAMGGMNTGNGMFQIGIILLAFFGPYFLIPKTAQVAGSAFANIAGIANNRSRGAFDRLRNARQNRAKQLHEDRDAGRTWLGSGRTGSLYRRGAAMGASGSWSPFSKGRNRWSEQEAWRREQAMDEALEKGGGRAFNDDDASELLAQKDMTRDKFVSAYGQKMIAQGRATNNAEAVKLAERALSRAEIATGARAGSTTMRVAAQKFRTAMTNTAYADGEAGLAALQRDLNSLVDDGLVTAADAASWMKANKGRADFSSNSFGSTVSFAQGYSVNPDGSRVDYTAAQQIEGAFEGADPREVLGSHQNTVKTFAAQAEKNMKKAIQSADPEAIDKALADVANIHSMLSNVSPKKANEFADRVFVQGTRISGVRPDPLTGENVTRELSVRELIDEARNTPALHSAFHDRVREYSSAREAQGAQSSGGAEEGAQG